MAARISSDSPMGTSWFRPTPDSNWARFRDKSRMRYANVFHLVWSVYVFGDLLFQQKLSPYWIPVTAVSFVLFLTIFWLVQVRPLRHVAYFGAAIALLGYGTMWANASGGACYIIFACSYMGFEGNPRRGLLRMALTIAAFLVMAYLYHWPLTVTLTLAFVAFSVGTVNLIYRFNAQKDAELKLSHDEVRRLAAMAERERIGRDLHDLLGHTLSLITLKLELSRRLIDRDTDAARREMEEAERVARHALAEVRAAVTGIRSTGIAAELASARLLLQASSVHFEYMSDVPTLPARVEAGLALILREAVTNIHRHAHATLAEARVELAGDQLSLCIADNGTGGVGTEGNGIAGMRERVRALGGTLTVESTRERGTRLRIVVPLTSADRLAPPPRDELPGPDRLAS